MTRNGRRYLSAAVVVGLVAALGLTGCGRKGPLEAPPSAAAIAAEAAGQPPPPPPPPKPDKPFFLDPLLD